MPPNMSILQYDLYTYYSAVPCPLTSNTNNIDVCEPGTNYVPKIVRI